MLSRIIPRSRRWNSDRESEYMFLFLTCLNWQADIILPGGGGVSYLIRSFNLEEYDALLQTLVFECDESVKDSVPGNGI